MPLEGVSTSFGITCWYHASVTVLYGVARRKSDRSSAMPRVASPRVASHRVAARASLRTRPDSRSMCYIASSSPVERIRIHRISPPFFSFDGRLYECDALSLCIYPSITSTLVCVSNTRSGSVQMTIDICIHLYTFVYI